MPTRNRSIVGFDQCAYRYASGRQGTSCVVGVSSRKNDLSVYLLAGYEDAETKALLVRLGKHKTGKACLYLKRLGDIQLSVLEERIASSVAETRNRPR